MTGFRRARALAPLLATALVALFALAVPASAHNGSKHRDADRPTGTIAAYDSATGVLTIDLTDGGSVSGLVTSRTWIDAGDRHKGCGEGKRKARSARKGGKRARHGDWCAERRSRHRRGGHGEGRGWHHGWRHSHGDASDLVAGAVVDDAILVLKDGKAWFAKIDLD